MDDPGSASSPGTSEEAGRSRVRRPLVVLPTFNERDNLEPLVRSLLSHEPSAHVWIIDDNSPDGTGDIADRLAAEDARISVVHRPCKLGLGTAYSAAFQRALAEGYEPVIQMYADFSHDPQYLP